MIIVSRDEPGPVEQADVFRALSGRDIVGLVVTADCDLARGKTWGTLHWVPVVSARSYALSSFGVDTLLKSVATEQEALIAAANQLALAPSEPALEDALSAGSVDALVELLGSLQGFSRERIQLLVDMKELLATLPARHSQWNEQTIANVEAMLVRGAVQRGSSRKKLAERLASRLSSPAGDVFLIPQAFAGVAQPAVVLLRFLQTCELVDVAPTIGVARTRGAPYYRVARMLPPYRYDLTRRFAAVFADIGLPDEYDTERKKVAANLKLSWENE